MLRFFVSFILLLALGARAEANWLRAESPNFIVYSEGSEAALRQRILLLEDFDRLLRFMTNVEAPPAPTKLTVYVVRGLRELRTVRPGLNETTAGFYAATPTGIAAFVDQRAEAGDNEVLFHEYAHHFMMQYAPGAYPAWYIEGFAEYFMTAKFDAANIDVGASSDSRGPWIMNGQWLPIDRVLFGRSEGLNPEGIARYYAQSWLMVHYFYSSDARRAQLMRYLGALAQGGDARSTMEPQLGLSPDALNTALRDYIRRGRITFTRLRRTSAQTPPPIQISRMPEAADDILLYRAALDVLPGDEKNEALLADIRRVANRLGNDPYARRVLAYAELSIGDAAAADGLLSPLIEASPNDPELLYLQGMRHLKASETAEDPEPQAQLARRAFARAFRANNAHFQTLYHYVRSMYGSDQFNTDNTLNILLRAHELAPQVHTVTFATASMLMNRQRYADAERILTPLSADVHNGSLAAAAKQLIERARSQSQPRQSGDEPAAAE